MRKFHLLLTLLCCFSATSLMAQVEEEDEDDNSSARIMFEKLQMQDPALGKAPGTGCGALQNKQQEPNRLQPDA
ncbi:MAG: hypothetical protein IPP73_00965 [Chitinophagaceae bacterium]|nr:hypothetical protein [Chitinophagaceae bacterium]